MPDNIEESGHQIILLSKSDSSVAAANSGSNLDLWKGDINSHWGDWLPGVELTAI